MKVENFKRFSLKMLRAKLECFLLVRLHDKSAIFYSAENAHAYESGPRPFCSWERRSLRVRLLAIGSMPPTKVCPLPFTYQVSSSNYNTGTAALRVWHFSAFH